MRTKGKNVHRLTAAKRLNFFLKVIVSLIFASGERLAANVTQNTAHFSSI